MLKLLELLGFPKTNKQGHEIGCSCLKCMAVRERREPFEPGTVGAMLQDAIKNRRKPNAKCERCGYLQHSGVVLIPAGVCPSCHGSMREIQ